ncbi:NERD domain-containing protein [Bacillus sp. FJAT-49754]|nr:NERD domain-containing protein [Lederbergia citrea]
MAAWIWTGLKDKKLRWCLGIIVKNRDKSLILQALQAGVVRIFENHSLSSTVLASFSSRQAGIAGEERVADLFRKHSFTMDHRIIHDISLSASTLFQMDSLFLTSSYALIFEVKNISGRLKFTENPPQLIRTRADGQVDGFDSPAAQVERYVVLLDEWLQGRGIRLPVIGVVVLAYPKQIVEQAPSKTRILFPNLIPSYIRSLSTLPIKLERDKLDWLTAEILRSHQRYIPDPLCEIYNIAKRHIRTGVECEVCGMLGMDKVLRNWHCKRCGNNNKLAHEKAIKEWFLLFGGKMTNRDCRKFLQIDDLHSATRILQSMNLRSDGAKRNRSYYMDVTENQ